MCIVELIDTFLLTTMAYKFSLSNERHYFFGRMGSFAFHKERCRLCISEHTLFSVKAIKMIGS